MPIPANKLKPGLVIKWNGTLYKVLDMEFRGTGKSAKIVYFSRKRFVLYICYIRIFICVSQQVRIWHASCINSSANTELKWRPQEVFHLQGSGKMTQTNLRLTIFEVQKLRVIVGQGTASPYQISTFPSDSLGMIGTVIDPSKQAAANGNFPVPEPVAKTSWLQRTKIRLHLI